MVLLKSALVCLALNIYHEARDQSTAGQLAVAQVTVNRVDSKHYPDTVCDVEYQKGKIICAFSWTCDGASDTPHEEKAWDKSMMLAAMTLDDNNSIDVVNGATHYHTTKVNPYWADSLKIVKQVGDHIFYK